MSVQNWKETTTNDNFPKNLLESLHNDELINNDDVKRKSLNWSRKFPTELLISTENFFFPSISGISTVTIKNELIHTSL